MGPERLADAHIVNDKAIAALGPPPLRYEVTLSLSGAVHRGTGVWPQDEIHDCSPCTRLHWDPPLPAL